MNTRHLILTLLFLSSSILSTQAQSVTGSGEVIEQERSLPKFTAIDVTSGIDVFIVQGNGQKVVVKADDNLVDMITTEVDGNTLIIDAAGSIRRARAFDVYITVEDLERIEASSGSDVKGESRLSFDKLDLKMSSGSDLELELEVRELSCRLYSGSDADLAGKVDELFLEASGGSDIKAGDLKAGNCTLEVSGGSDAYIHVEGDLKVKASGASDVYVSGNPNIVSQKATGGSDIRTK